MKNATCAKHDSIEQCETRQILGLGRQCVKLTNFEEASAIKYSTLS